MSIINALSISDMALIQKWCKTVEGRDINERNAAPMTEVLKYWAEAKENLFHMLGDQLILEKHIRIPRDSASISHEIEGYRYAHNSNPIDDFRRTISYNLPEGMIKNRIMAMLETRNLAANRAHCAGEVELKDGRIFKWDYDSKCMKVLGKLMGEYPEYYDQFEAMRQFVSRFTQESSLEGDLCISIHPMDFITASDNGYNWTSCMSYQDGDYHMGTIEMMNSPIVVVAYLKGEKPYCFNSLCWPGNKKWRSFFIVCNELITNVKGYPYTSDSLNMAVLNILKPLYEQYYHTNLQKCEFDGNLCELGDCYGITFSMDMMYNDMDTVNHFGYMRPLDEILTEDNWPMSNGVWLAEKTQSMMSTIECMNCGKTDAKVSVDTNSVFCADCDYDTVVCSECGCRIDNEDDQYWVEGLDGPVCCECFEDKAFVNIFTDYYNLRTEGITLTIIDSRVQASCFEEQTVYSELALTEKEYTSGIMGDFFTSAPIAVKHDEDGNICEFVYDILTASYSLLRSIGIERPYGYWFSDVYTNFGKYTREQVEELYKYADANAVLIKEGIDARSAQGQAKLASLLAPVDI